MPVRRQPYVLELFDLDDDRAHELRKAEYAETRALIRRAIELSERKKCRRVESYWPACLN